MGLQQPHARYDARLGQGQVSARRFLRSALAAAALIVALTTTSCAFAQDGYRAEAMAQMLDAKTPEAERQALFDRCKQDAIAGDIFAQYVIGSLYHVGKALAANVVERDLDMAKRYLSTAAAHGRLDAMAKMVDIEYDAHHYLEAMVWAQVYGHYILDARKADAAPRAESFLADLIHRIDINFDAKQTAEMQNDVNQFVAAHDKDIRAGMGRPHTPYQTFGLHRHIENPRYRSDAERKTNQRADVIADYFVSFAPDGSARQAWLIDAMPDLDIGRELRVLAMRTHVEPAKGDALRYGLIDLHYTHKNFELKNTAP